MDLGTKIKVQREKKNWSQQELADQIHISRQSISKWEQNKAIPSITNIVMMSNLFNISLDELMKDDEILVKKMDAQMKIARSLRNIMISVLIAFVLFIIIASFHVNIYNIREYFTDAALVIVIMIMFKIDWHQLDKAIPRKISVLIVIALVLYLIPGINDFIMSFITGWQDAVKDATNG
ncbi:helix-turn-helix domain-containing protein [Weissella hellenica]|uniref:Helix-turn-helix n=1 Tax=Weissella hellenica TaxID=46256 RepID=A0A4Y4G3D5_WEIHE|nr:helix-turn-helix transcriptional regulator [Weissella hellenica]NKY67591.1 helix-turn-helix transcriptional regulator [Weissella hellenica]GED35385.1 hypothetical protein WHE01_02890 [Weissella hellenica]SCB74449.1 Helix-turn-helix [Weissella hellenica]